MGNKFFLKEIFLGGNFGEHVFSRSRFFWGGNFASKVFENFLRAKSHSGEEKNTGKQKCFGGKIWGAKNLRANFYL